MASDKNITGSDIKSATGFVLSFLRNGLKPPALINTSLSIAFAIHSERWQRVMIG
jgi:hypothetical protein